MASVSKVFVHIGPLKTGTTFIQAVLFQNRQQLLGNRVLLPRAPFGRHVKSVLDLMSRRPRITKRGGRDAWDLMADEVADGDADSAVLSMEFLCTASPAAVQRMVRSFAPAEVHIAYTARDLTKVIPAAWQTVLRNKQAPTWPMFIRSLRDAAATSGANRSTRSRILPTTRREQDESWGSKFWRQQDPRQVLEPYLAHVPADRVHVVTVPVSGSPPELLWERFCAATQLDPAAYDIEVRRSNTSLGGVECEVLRRMNTRVAGRIPGAVYGDLIKLFLAREVLEQREQSFPLVLADEDLAWVTERAADAVDYFRTGGFVLHGDLTDLEPSARGERTSARQPDDVRETELLPVLEETLAAVLLEMTRRQGLLDYRGPRSLDQPLPPPEELGLTGEPPSPGSRRTNKAKRAGRKASPAVAEMKAAGRRRRRAEKKKPGAKKAGGKKAGGKKVGGKKVGGKKVGGKKVGGKKVGGKKVGGKKVAPERTD